MSEYKEIIKNERLYVAPTATNITSFSLVFVFKQNKRAFNQGSLRNH